MTNANEGNPENSQHSSIHIQDLLVRMNRQWVRIPWRSIVFIEAERTYSKIHLVNPKTPYLLVRAYISDIEQQLSPIVFCRVHRSYIVGVMHVRHIQKDLVNLGNTEVPLVKEYTQALLSKFVLLGVIETRNTNGEIPPDNI